MNDMFKAGKHRYHRGHKQYYVIYDAVHKQGWMKEMSLCRSILRSNSTLSKNEKYAYIRLTQNQARYLNENVIETSYDKSEEE